VSAAGFTSCNRPATSRQRLRRHKNRKASVGALVATLACLPKAEKAKDVNRWVILLIDGPREPKHVSALLEPVMKEWLYLATTGIVVEDALTGCPVLRKFAPGPSACDMPATAKLGEGPAHSGYHICKKCFYLGVICGCKRQPGEPDPTPWDNEGYPGHGARTFQPSETPFQRSKRPGEHICWVDSQMIELGQYRSEVNVIG
jgi:hypothetical protein